MAKKQASKRFRSIRKKKRIRGRKGNNPQYKTKSYRSSEERRRDRHEKVLAG